MSERKGIFWGKFSLFMYVCIGPCHGTNVEGRGQCAKVCFLLSFVSRGLGYQAWWQVPLPTEPSHWPLDSQYEKFKSCMQMTRNFEKVDCQEITICSTCKALCFHLVNQAVTGPSDFRCFLLPQI